MLSSVLQKLWQRRLVRVACGLAVFAAALLAQYFLTDVPVPANLAETGKFTPAALTLGEQELIIEGPEVNSSEGTLFSHVGTTDELVDVHFERAHVDKDTAAVLRALGDTLPDTDTTVTYVPQEPEQGAPCRTEVTVAWADPRQPPTVLRLFQLGAPGLDSYRSFQLHAEGSALAVQLLPKAGDEAATVARGCQNLLTIGELEEQLTGEVGATVVAAPGSVFRWHFRRAQAGQSPWGSAAGFFEPFALGAPQLSKQDRPPLQARAVRIRALNAPPDAPDRLSARSTDDGPPLSISALNLGSDQLRINVNGYGWVKIDGADRTTNVFERVEKYPLTAALFGAANSALLAWIGYAIFGRHKPAPTPAAAPEPAAPQNP